MTEQPLNAEPDRELVDGPSPDAGARAAAPEGAAFADEAAERASDEGGDAALRQPSGPQLKMPGRPATDVRDPRQAGLEVQLADSKQQLQRLAADFENFRRRAASEREELMRFAASRALENFLPIVDNFERALAHAGSADSAAMRQGVEMIYRQVADFLSRQGVAAMETVGQIFDPNLHEAIGQVESTTHPDNSILAEAQKGYFLNGRVLRHAMVQIASNPAGRPEVEAASPVEAGAESESTGDDRESASTVAGSGADAPLSAEQHTEEFTLEDLMAEAAPVSEGNKEESHG